MKDNRNQKEKLNVTRNRGDTRPTNPKNRNLRGEMKLYYIERNDGAGYDEYDSAVVVARTPEEALIALKTEHGEDEYCTWRHYDVTIKEIVPSSYEEPTIIIESFNAG